MSEYTKRDHMAQGEHYLRHVSAMTGEGLHTKSAIAGELAHRDIEIERLTDDYAAATHLLADRDAQIERLKAELATLRASAASVQADQRAEIDAANAVLDELIACKDLKDDIDKMPSCKARWLKEEEYDLRDPLAWEAARTLRKGTT